MATIQLTPATAVPYSSIRLRFVRSGGPGGQNVNKVATAVELRFDLMAAGLSPQVQARLERLVGRRLAQSGEVVIFAQRFRTQNANREDAMARLSELVRRAEHAPKRRIATQASPASKRRRRDTKEVRSSVKRLRAKPGADE